MLLKPCKLIEDIIYEIDNLEEESVIFLQDQEKAFDRVEWSWLFLSLKHFNFGDTFISWLQTLYNKMLQVSEDSTLGQGYTYSFSAPFLFHRIKINRYQKVPLSDKRDTL